jgi:hypothetical protein
VVERPRVDRDALIKQRREQAVVAERRAHGLKLLTSRADPDGG